MDRRGQVALARTFAAQSGLGGRQCCLYLEKSVLNFNVEALTLKLHAGISRLLLANSAISKLVELKILRQRTAGRYDRIFQCDAVLTTLEY